MFPFFPYTNFHRLNADWILQKVKELAQTVETAAASIETWADRITQAQTDAAAAVSTANAAQSTANAAQSTANAAQSAANAAQSAAANSVKYTTQQLTVAQRRTACTNINAVSYQTQGLSGEERAQARVNIGAASADDIPDVTDVVRYSPQITTDAQKRTARGNIEALGAGDLPDLSDVVRTSAQTFTEAQKTQARSNIGASSATDISDVVRTSAQTFTAAQKTQARSNIGAASTDEVSDLQGLATYNVDIEETAQGVYQCSQTLVNILEAFAHYPAVIVNLYPYNSSLVYRGLAQLAGPDSTGPVYANLLEPNAPDSIVNSIGYRVYLASSGGSDVLTVTSYNFRLAPAASSADAGKVLGIDNLGRSAWINRGPLVLEFATTNPYTVATPLADILAAINAGRQVFFKGVFAIGNGADAYLPLSAYGLQTGSIIYLAFGGEYASQYVVFDDAGDGWTTGEI